MSRFECARTAQGEIGASRASSIVNPFFGKPAYGKSARLLLAIIGAASLAACVEGPVAQNRSELAASRQAAVDQHRMFRSAAVVRHRHFVRHHAPDHDVAGRQVASQGLASFYSEGKETASGEKFDKNELTAAHPTLPFGTRLRVTDVSTGRSVTVRVNDRGPYVRGRIVDVSHSAAEELGMVGKGVANVRLDVVQ